MSSRLKRIAALAAVLWTTVAAAHHSTAMFDNTRQVTISGVVKELQWTNPHAWLQVLVPDDDGTLVEWGVEMGALSAMIREGWRPRIVQPGDKISVVVSPLRSGKPGGLLISANREDGTVIGGRKPGT